MTPHHIIQRVKDAVDIAALVAEYVQPLRKFGGRHVGKCPFHEERTASFGVNERSHFHCFGCGAQGDCFEFLQQIEGIPFHEALKRLADRAGISLDAKPISPRAQRWAQEEAAFCRWWWERRYALQYAAIHQAMESAEESWLDALGTPLRYWDGLSVQERWEHFRTRATAADRTAWLAEIADKQAYADAWIAAIRAA